MKAKYLLPCSCGREIPVEASQAGQEIGCSCGATLEVPAMRGLAGLDRASSKPAAPRSTSTWDTRQAVILVGAVITVLGLGWATLMYVFRPRMTDAELLSPIQTWQLWHDLSYGLDQRPISEQMYLEGLAWYRRWMVVALAIVGIGLVVMAGSLLVRGRRRRPHVRRPSPRARSPGPTAGS